MYGIIHCATGVWQTHVWQTYVCETCKRAETDDEVLSKDTLDFYEVKTDARRLDMNALAVKVAAFFRKHPEMQRDRFGIKGLSIEDM